MSEQEKQKRIVNMFDSIASTYDKANRILSFGIDTIWRKKACNNAYRILGKRKLSKIVDVACGTGDMMHYWERQAVVNKVRVDDIIGIDPSRGMVGVGRDKFPHLSFEIAPATQLPLKDESADIVSIAYGIRNVMEREEAFAEFHRILKQDGLVVILEFTKNKDETTMGKIRDFYLQKVLPSLGGLISKNREEYQYLPDSIDSFATTKMLEDELKSLGFEIKEAKSFSFNISTMIIAQKI